MHVLFNLDVIYDQDDIHEAFDLSLPYVDRRGLDLKDQPGELYSHVCNSKVYIYFNIFFLCPKK